MKKQFLLVLLMMLPMVASAHDIAVKNGDGVTIYYNYINDSKELEVTFRGDSYSSYSGEYTGNIVIPEEVTYMNRTRKVTSIGERAFSGCWSLATVTILNSVASIGNYAFYGCSGLTSVTIGNSVTSIGDYAFYGCSGLTSVTIGNSVTSIGNEAFYNCSGLRKVIVSDIAAWCDINFNGNYDGAPNNPLYYAHHIYSDENTEIKDLVIPNGVTSIGNNAFRGCSGLTSVTIGNSVTSIGNEAFYECSGLRKVIVSDIAAWCGINFSYDTSNPLYYAHHIYSDENTEIKDLVIPNSVTCISNNAFCGCSGLTSFTIPNSVTSIGHLAFYGCTGLTSISIPNSVTSIGNNTFNGCDITTVISLIENPFAISGKTSDYLSTFSLNTINNATLYVPEGTIDKYKATDGWKDFVFIEEGIGGSVTPPTPEKCEKPTIAYSKGKLIFTCSTEGATCHSTITDTDIKSYSGNEVQLAVTYNISVYATKNGCENSETATASLCWIDATPQMEGTTNELTQIDVHSIAARPVLVKTDDGFITVEGIDDQTNVRVYTTDGKLAGTATSHNNTATIATNIKAGSTAIVKVGEKAIKVIMK